MNHLAATAAAALITAIWQGAILAAVVALTLRLLPAIPAATRSLIWTATFALLVALHVLPSLHFANATATSTPTHALHFASFWSFAVAAIWLTLSGFRAAQFLLSAYRLHEINQRAVPIDTAQRAPFSGGRPYTLCTSPDVDRPSVLGFFHPRILLPAGLLETLTTAELEQILLHETEHLRRSDDWTNLLQKLALVLFPLNPVLLWVERRLCLERELACDARVLSAGENLRKSYATTLTRLAEHSILRRGMNLALGLLGQRARTSELSTRVHRILDRPANTLTRTQTRLATATVLTGLLTLSTTLAHAPSLISFTSQAGPALEANLSAPAFASETWGPKVVPAKAIVPSQTRTTYRTIAAVAHLPIAPHRHAVKSRPSRPLSGAPRLMSTAYREASSEQPTRDQQPRFTLTVASGTQVQQFVVPAVAYIPAAYAAVRTPDGWIIFQL